MTKLLEKYQKEIRPKLMEEFGINNSMATPRLIKIIINIGIGDLLKNKEGKEAILRDFSAILGQKLAERKARISVSAFSVRDRKSVV